MFLESPERTEWQYIGLYNIILLQIAKLIFNFVPLFF